MRLYGFGDCVAAGIDHALARLPFREVERVKMRIGPRLTVARYGMAQRVKVFGVDLFGGIFRARA